MYVRLLTAFGLTLLAGTSVWGQVELKEQLPENTTQQFSIDKVIKQTVTINGNDISSEVDDRALLEAKYGQRKDGVLPIEYRYAGWQAEVDVNGDKVRFDAANPDDGGNDSPIHVLLDTYRQMAKRPFTLDVDEDGRVIDLRGWDDILDDLGGESKTLHRDMLEGRYLRELWTTEFQRLPTTPVSVGDTWERTVEHRVPGGQSLTFTTEYKYAGAIERDGQKFERIEMKTTKVEYAMNADASAPLVVSDSDLKVVEAEGEMLFDVRRRQIASVKEKLHIQGGLTFTVTANDAELPGKLDLHLETAQTLLP